MLSWGQWVERHGFLDEMAALTATDQAELKRRERWDDLTSQVAFLTVDPVRAAAEKGLLDDLVGRAERLNRRDASHPSVFVLRQLHGLPAGLAEAAALYSAAVPAWALVAIAFATLLTGLFCVGAFLSILGGRLGSVGPFLVTLVFSGFLRLRVRPPPTRETPPREGVARPRRGLAGRAGPGGTGMSELASPTEPVEPARVVRDLPDDSRPRLEHEQAGRNVGRPDPSGHGAAGDRWRAASTTATRAARTGPSTSARSVGPSTGGSTSTSTSRGDRKTRTPTTRLDPGNRGTPWSANVSTCAEAARERARRRGGERQAASLLESHGREDDRATLTGPLSEAQKWGLAVDLAEAATDG